MGTGLSACQYRLVWPLTPLRCDAMRCVALHMRTHLQFFMADDAARMAAADHQLGMSTMANPYLAGYSRESLPMWEIQHGLDLHVLRVPTHYTILCFRHAIFAQTRVLRSVLCTSGVRCAVCGVRCDMLYACKIPISVPCRFSGAQLESTVSAVSLACRRCHGGRCVCSQSSESVLARPFRDTMSLHATLHVVCHVVCCMPCYLLQRTVLARRFLA